MSKTKWTLAEEEALMQIIGTKRSPSFTWNDLGKLNFLFFWNRTERSTLIIRWEQPLQLNEVTNYPMSSSMSL